MSTMTERKTLTFPSVNWFEELRTIMNTDVVRFKELGTADCTFGVRIDDEDGEMPSRLFAVTLEDWVCTGVVEDDPDTASCDFVLEADFPTWQEMIENIEEHGYADLHHTLMFLSLPGTPIYVNAETSIGLDLFSRYNQTLQEFVNSTCRFHTKFKFSEQ